MRHKKLERLKAVGYARVSTKSQDLTLQQKTIREFCDKQDFELLEIYAEQISGATFDRPEYLRMLGDIRDGRNGDLEFVIVTNFDRFSRTTRVEAEEKLEELNEMGVSVWGIENTQVAAPDDSLDVRFATGITLYIAHHMRRLIIRKMQKGFDDKLKRQKSEKGLEEGERPIGRPMHVFTEAEVKEIKKLRRKLLTKAYIWRMYVKKIERFSKMTLPTFYKVCKRQGID